MKNYYLYNDRVKFVDDDGSDLTIYFNSDSGKVYCRDKIGSIFGVVHSGINLGGDLSGQDYFLHNHYEKGRPTLDTGSEFRKGFAVRLYKQTVTNTPLKTIENALRQTVAREPYHAIFHNCQTFTNLASENIRKSEDVKNIFEKLAFVAVLYFGVKQLIKQN